MSREEINNKGRGIDETGGRRFWVVKPNIDVERVLALEEPWLCQMWTQVYETLYKPDPQGFRLTKEEMADLQAHNEAYAKPLPGEIEILDQLNFAVPDKDWLWITASRLAKETSLKYLNAIQVGRVLSKLSKLDPRIQMKNIHNTKQYLLPPAREFQYYPSDDDRGVFFEDRSVPSWCDKKDYAMNAPVETEPEWLIELRDTGDFSEEDLKELSVMLS